MHVRLNMTSPKVTWYPPVLSEYARTRAADDEEDAAASTSKTLSRLCEDAFRTCNETDEGEKNTRLANLMKDIEKTLHKRSAEVVERRNSTDDRELRASGCSDRVPKLRPLHNCPNVRDLQIAQYKVFPFPASDAEQKQLDKFYVLLKEEGALRRIALTKAEWDRWDEKVRELKQGIEAAEAGGQVRKNLEGELKGALRNLIASRRKFYSELQFERSKGTLLETVKEVTAGRGPAYDWWIEFLANKYVLYADQVDHQSEWWRFNLTDGDNGDGAERSGNDYCADASEGMENAPVLDGVEAQMYGKMRKGKGKFVHRLTWCERPKKVMVAEQKAAVLNAKADEAAGIGVLGESPVLEYGKYALVRCNTNGREHDFAVARILEDKTCEDYNDEVRVSWLHPQKNKGLDDYSGTYDEELLKEPPEDATGDDLLHNDLIGLSTIHVYGLEMPIATRPKKTRRREFSSNDKQALVSADIGFQLSKNSKLSYKRRDDDDLNKLGLKIGGDSDEDSSEMFGDDNEKSGDDGNNADDAEQRSDED